MKKVHLSHQFHSLLKRHAPRTCRFYPCKPPLFSVFFTTSPNGSYTSTPNPKNTLLEDYLTNSLEFPKTKAISISNRFSSIDSTEKPKAIVGYLKSLGLSITQLQSSITRQPTLLFADVDKTLKPKIAFYQELGVCGPRLGILISKNPALLTSSLDKKLKPSIGVIKKVLQLYGSEKDNDSIDDVMFRILSRYGWVIACDTRLDSNIMYLQGCGVIGSQLIMLLKTELRLFSMREAELKKLVSRVVDLGFEMGSRMLVYGVMALYSNSAETIDRKFELLRTLGFSKDECNLMFIKSPTLFKASEAKLRRGVEFFTNTLMFDKSMLVGSPFILKFSMDKRIIPRFEVLEMLKSMRPLERRPSFVTVLLLSEKKFVEKFILKFGEDAKELKVAYKKHLSKS